MRSMLAEARRLQQEAEGKEYAGPIGDVASRYDVYPPGTIPVEELDVFVEAVRDSNMTRKNLTEEFENARTETSQKMALLRRIRKLNQGPPKDTRWTMPNERDKILKNVTERMEEQKQIDNKARMAYVRRFKKR